MTQHCENCGAAVSDRYVRVLSRDGDTVRACPRCPDLLRRNGRIRPARATRRGSGADVAEEENKS